MATVGYTLFDTALGCCGVAWSEHGLHALQLPEADAATARARLLRRAPDALEATPPPLVRKAIAGVSGLLGGERVDLSPLPLDLRGIPELHARIYDIVRRIPCGSTLSYGQVAERWATGNWRARWARRWRATPSRQWCPATACSAPMAGPAASRRAADCAPSCNC